MELMKTKKIQTSIKFIFIVMIVIQIGCSKDDGENTRQLKTDVNKKTCNCGIELSSLLFYRKISTGG